MNKKDGFLNSILKSGILFYCLPIAVCGLAVCFYNALIGVLIVILSLVLLFKGTDEDKDDYGGGIQYYSSMSEVNDKFDITKGITTAMISVGTDGKINWWNDAFTKICPLVAMHDGITEHIPEITMDMLYNMESTSEVKIGYKEHSYVLSNVPFKANNAADSAFVLTLRDVTELEHYKKEAQNLKTVIAHVLIDNYDELLTEEGDDVSYKAEKSIESLIFEWTRKLGGTVRHIEKGRYMCLFNSEMLDEIKEAKFDVLEKAKTLGEGSAIEPTLSIGVGIDGDDINEIDTFAKAALDMALGRGGDQAVIKDKENFSYYGGKSRETEKRTKVKSRVKALALLNLIDECSNVIIMGHVNADADSFASCVALACSAMARGKQAKVLIETYDRTVKAILESFEKNKTNLGLFVNKMQARELMGAKTLVIVCDTHRRNLVASTEILDEAASVVLIDHHRRSEDFILNTDLLYHEPFASSSCEMVAEMLQYMGRGGINNLVAEAMYAGIVVDTNNFIYKTGVRTFEAAAYLKRLGADTVNVRRLFRENKEAYEEKSMIVANSRMYSENIALSHVYETVRQDVIAKAANDLLEMENVEAAFVVAPIGENRISVTGRSFGDINIQLICEKLGGGGHMLAGAAQLEDVDVDEAVSKLYDVIEEYKQER